MHSRGRYGTRQDAAEHNSPLDATQAGQGERGAYGETSCRGMSHQPREELGGRDRQVAEGEAPIADRVGGKCAGELNLSPFVSLRRQSLVKDA